METAYQEGDQLNQLAIDKLFYSFPISESITITAGPLVGQEDMLAIWPSVYPSDPILDVLTLNGHLARNKNLGAGAGIVVWYERLPCFRQLRLGQWGR